MGRSPKPADAADRDLARNYLTPAEVGRIVGVAPTTVTRWAREGRLPCLVTLGGHRRFDPAVVELLKKNLVRGLPEAASHDGSPEDGAKDGPSGKDTHKGPVR